jgi:(1->4)-alpha-D-glucan 1-alpha-D-glucosylmutase
MTCEGTHAEHVFAFARRSGTTWVVVAVPRLMASLIADALELPLGESVWRDTRLVLPVEASVSGWRNLFTGERLSAVEQNGQRALAATQVFAHFPVAVLVSGT